MSPLSVSDTLPLDKQEFDVVVFDEASQITLEDAVPALFRAPQAIIVGDQMQLPPTDFFATKREANDDEELLVELDGDLVQYDLNTGSFLSHAARNLPSAMLGWHYRSRSESLISFSNWAFYEGGLLTVPEETRFATARPPIQVHAAEDGSCAAESVLDRPISFHFMGNGVYDDRRNRAEAEYIAELVRDLLAGPQEHTIGIVAFSEAQQDEIEQALSRLANEDKTFRGRLEEEIEREQDGQLVGLLIKNLENIQGDERDIIILSVCYGPPPSGKMKMNFGPINNSGGHKRLNVAFSRAKHHMAVVASMNSNDITNDYNEGANCLKNYLRYAQAVSEGDAATARAVLESMRRWRSQQLTSQTLTPTWNAVAQQLRAALQERGFQVDSDVGQSKFQCDLAVYRDGDPQYRLGILVDDGQHYQDTDVLEREVMRPSLLRAFGWQVALVLAKDWDDDRDHVLDRLLNLLGPETRTAADAEETVE